MNVDEILLFCKSAGKHLAELCKSEYPKYVKYCLRLLAEVALIATDIPEGWHFTLVGSIKKKTHQKYLEKTLNNGF